MRLPPPKPPLDWEEAERLYVDEGLTYQEVGRQLGYDDVTVSKALREHGVEKRKPSAQSRKSRHGVRLYGIFKFMHGRCRNPANSHFKYYGAQGIRVCEEWATFDPFYSWAMHAGYKPGLNLGLLDPQAGYSPTNCLWQKQRFLMARPPRTTRNSLTVFGETKTPCAWAADPRCAVSYMGLLARLRRGEDPKSAITRPPLTGKPITSRTGPLPKPARRLVDWDRAIQLFDAGAEREDIAREFGVTYGAISSGLKQRGIFRLVTRQTKDEARLRNIWRSMRRKCENPSDMLYQYFGARGIAVCARWSEFEPFMEWARSTGFALDLSLVRKKDLRDFTPSNCAWVKTKDVHYMPQRHVKSPSGRWTVEAFGEFKSPTAWARDPRCRVSRTNLLWRLRQGESPELAISMPPRSTGGGQASCWITAFGQTKSLREWANDRRARVGESGIRERIERGIAPEVAITTPGFRLGARPPRTGSRSRGRT